MNFFFENRLIFVKYIASYKVGRFLRHSVVESRQYRVVRAEREDGTGWI